VTRRTVKKEWQVAGVLRAISVMDLTTLLARGGGGGGGGGTRTNGLRRDCVPKDGAGWTRGLVKLLGSRAEHISAAICVYHAFVENRA